MAKTAQPKDFTVPPESITKGGSYVVDPVAQTVERVEFTQTVEEAAAAAGASQQPASE